MNRRQPSILFNPSPRLSRLLLGGGLAILISITGLSLYSSANWAVGAGLMPDEFPERASLEESAEESADFSTQTQATIGPDPLGQEAPESGENAVLESPDTEPILSDTATLTEQATPDENEEKNATGFQPAEPSSRDDLADDAAGPDLAEFKQLSPQTLAQLHALYEAMQLESRGIYHDIRDDEGEAAKNIALLWQAAVERSGTIRYAIEKLSHRDATGQPVADDGFTKKMLQNVARLGGIAGSMWTGSPASMIGGGMVDNILTGDPTESALQRVTDADMVLLAKEVEALQTRVIELYYEYCHAEERLHMVQEANRTLGRFYDQALNKAPLDPGMESLMASLYETSQQEEDQARQSYKSARDALTLLVGPDAMTAFEQIRENEAHS